MLHTDLELGFGHFLYHSGDFFLFLFVMRMIQKNLLHSYGAAQILKSTVLIKRTE